MNGRRGKSNSAPGRRQGAGQKLFWLQAIRAVAVVPVSECDADYTKEKSLPSGLVVCGSSHPYMCAGARAVTLCALLFPVGNTLSKQKEKTGVKPLKEKQKNELLGVGRV